MILQETWIMNEDRSSEMVNILNVVDYSLEFFKIYLILKAKITALSNAFSTNADW